VQLPAEFLRRTGQSHCFDRVLGTVRRSHEMRYQVAKWLVAIGLMSGLAFADNPTGAPVTPNEDIIRRRANSQPRCNQKARKQKRDSARKSRPATSPKRG
jgi:hypothetical protein